MKKISVEVCLNEYTWLEIWEKEKWIVQKDQVKKKIKKMEKKKRSISAIWGLLWKVSGIDVIYKEKLCCTSL